MAEYLKPLPVADPETQPFWDGCKRHELSAQRCRSCRRLRWPPVSVCSNCHSWEFEWVPLAETGKVETYVVVHHATAAAFKEDAPYVVAYILIDGTGDRVSMASNIIDCPWEDVRIGMLVRVVFDDVTPEVTLPKFRPT
jgi:uncharacterized OB-fold protein